MDCIFINIQEVQIDLPEAAKLLLRCKFKYVSYDNLKNSIKIINAIYSEKNMFRILVHGIFEIDKYFNNCAFIKTLINDSAVACEENWLCQLIKYTAK